MKRDEGRRLTDAELEALEKRIREMYGGAAKNLQQIIDEYFANFRLRDEEMHKLIGTVVNGREWTEEDYKQWRLAQMGRGERFEALRDKLAERLTNANEVAISYVNDATPGIYTLNRNYAAYEVSDAGGDFTLYDEQTVRRLIVEQPDLMPYYPKEKAVRSGIDLAFGKKQITNAVTSGILMGRSSRGIAADLRRRIVDMSIESAIRAARTAVTAAENGGRQATYEKAAEMGIEIQREWRATKDFRTRHWHGIADGQVVGVKDPFIVGGEKLMFPGDKSLGASGWNIYNCRCALKKHGRDREKYSEWLEKKMEEDPEGTTLEFKKTARRSADFAQWQEYRKIVPKETPKTFDEFQIFKYTELGEWKKLKAVKHMTEVVNDAPCITTPAKYSGYFLKAGAKHADDFFDVGYTSDDVLKLRYDMARQFDMDKAVDRATLKNGAETFNIYMTLGVTKKKMFLTGWRIDKPGDKPRIITCFRKDNKDA